MAEKETKQTNENVQENTQRTKKKNWSKRLLIIGVILLVIAILGLLFTFILSNALVPAQNGMNSIPVVESGNMSDFKNEVEDKIKENQSQYNQAKSDYEQQKKEIEAEAKAIEEDVKKTEEKMSQGLSKEHSKSVKDVQKQAQETQEKVEESKSVIDDITQGQSDALDAIEDSTNEPQDDAKGKETSESVELSEDDEIFTTSLMDQFR